MIFGRPSFYLLVCAILMSGAPQRVFSGTDGFAIGLLRADTVDYIMYFKNGSWSKSVLLQEVNNHQNRQTKLGVEEYARKFWGSSGVTFSNWYEINQTKPIPVRSQYAFLNYPGKCVIERGVMTMRTDNGGKRAWVSTRKAGLRWNDFEYVAHSFRGEIHNSIYKHVSPTPVPKEYELLVNEVKSRWASSDINTHSGKGRKDDVEQNTRLAKMEYHEFEMEQTPLSKGRKLLFFFGRKYSSDLGAEYRAWAIAESDGSVIWVSDRRNPGDFVVPDGVLEFDDKLYLIVEVHEDSDKDRRAKKIFEILDGKLTYRSETRVQGCDPYS